MGFGDDEDILQDFLVEAGEILENLSEQLVELESRPEDKELLNAIFRGFHTVKGGAGFLQVTPMVDCCHATENLFDSLRNGKREVSSDLMDVVLQALDVVNEQFAQLNNRDPDITPPPPQLIDALERMVNGEPAPAAGQSAGESEPAISVENHEDQKVRAGSDITDDEFENLLDALSSDEGAAAGSGDPGSGKRTGAKPSGGEGSDEISEDEFEALLDELHGQGQAPKQPAGGASKKPDAAHQAPSSKSGSDEITDDEFEKLLDDLHGKGQGPAGLSPSDASAPSAKTGGSDKAASEKPSEPEKSGKAGQDDKISEDEFEDLLDQLHGRGKGPGTGKDAAPKKSDAAPTQPAIPQPAKRPEKDNAPPVDATVRVDTQRLDEIMNMVGELVLVRNRLVRLGDENQQNEALSKAVSNLDVVTGDLQTSVMKTRMQPVKKVFGRFPRVVRDLARKMEKEIALEMVGEDTDLDKNLVEALADPLVHLVRNSVDHGIEMPDDREKRGKPRKGKVVLGAEQEGDHILLSITDDGGGMDPDKLRDIAVDKGLFDRDSVQRLTDAEAFNLIFAPGFSSKKEISDVSGRGVGMDVVKTKITQLNGTIHIDSKVGEGTRFNIKVPLTLAIMPTLMVMLDDQTFALPLVSVNEIFHMDLRKSHVVDGQECVSIRDRAIPIFYLKNWLVAQPAEDARDAEWAHVVIVAVGTRQVGFVVDQLIGQEEVVIKPLGKMLQGTPGMAGATITGDGTIALILDVPSLLKYYSGSV